MRTCSVSCSQTHKTRASCSGVRDPAKYIPVRTLGATTVDMDYAFLKKVKQTKERGQKEAKKLERGQSMNARRKMLRAKKDLVRKKAVERGVLVSGVPDWMERRKINKSVWDVKCFFRWRDAYGRDEVVLWTVEWIVMIANESRTIVEHQYSIDGICLIIVSPTLRLSVMSFRSIWRIIESSTF